jgi:hypothetical protein
MANVWYAKGIQKIANGSVLWASHTIKAVLLDTADYTLNRTTHEFLSDIPAAARVATTTLSGCSVSDDGVLDANDATFTAVSGDQSEALAIYRDTGVEGTSPLLLYIDSATGLPFTPSGADESVAWDNGSNKIARLNS